MVNTMNILTRGASAISLFDVRLLTADHDVITLRGSSEESAGFHLKGVVLLSLNESTSIKRIVVKIYGTLRLKWDDVYENDRGGTSVRHFKYDAPLYEHEWKFLEFIGSKGNLHTLSAGNYEYPFDVVLPGSVPESVEGLDGAAMVYKMKSVLERGRFSNNVTRKKHIRIIRTLSPDAVELTETISIENIWTNKVDYSISIPSKAVIIGSSTDINISIIPLLKGLKLGQIIIALKEYYSYHIPPNTSHSNVRLILQKTIPAPKDGFLFKDKWDILSYLDIPANLAKVCQDCDINGNIKIRHKLKFAVSLVNPDNHVSELRASLPITLFISPNLSQLSPTNSSIAHSSSQNLLSNAALAAPPSYHEHIYDRLWHDIPDNGGLIDTPLPSGATTPSLVMSRRNSNDGSAGGARSLSLLDLPANRAQLAAGLRRALEDQASESAPSDSDSRSRTIPRSYNSSSAPSISSNFPSSTIGNNTNVSHNLLSNHIFNSRLSSRSNSGATTPHNLYLNSNQSENHLIHSPEVQNISVGNTPVISPFRTPNNEPADEFDVEALSRVPSYNAAMRLEQNVSVLDAAPDYDSVVNSDSNPPSRND